MKRILVVAIVLALSIGLLPTAAFAGDTSTGSFTAENVLPTITSVEIIPAGGGSALTSMTPGVAYKAKIVAGDANTVEDIDQVRVAIVYTAAASDPTDDPGETGYTQTLACLKWVKSGDAWSISPVGGSPATTWSITSGSCTKPSDMGLTTGTWEFYFTVGKVATKALGGNGVAGWDLFGEVKDEGTAVESWGDRDLGMAWYGGIAVTGNAAFGSVALGCVDAASSAVSATYISNGDYSEQVKSSTPWAATGGSVALNIAGTPGSGEFSLKADDDATTDGYVQVLSVSYVDIAADESLTTESGDTTADNTLWLSLGSSGIPVGAYTGTVTYKIANR